MSGTRAIEPRVLVMRGESILPSPVVIDSLFLSLLRSDLSVFVFAGVVISCTIFPREPLFCRTAGRNIVSVRSGWPRQSSCCTMTFPHSAEYVLVPKGGLNTSVDLDQSKAGRQQHVRRLAPNQDLFRHGWLMGLKAWFRSIASPTRQQVGTDQEPAASGVSRVFVESS
jgi:hypothetical protein